MDLFPDLDGDNNDNFSNVLPPMSQTEFSPVSVSALLLMNKAKNRKIATAFADRFNKLTIK
jgi:hypothetical protein